MPTVEEDFEPSSVSPGGVKFRTNEERRGSDAMFAGVLLWLLL
jgi:hypothetical protein